MKLQFAQALEQLGKQDQQVCLITADLGFNAFESIRDQLGNRFINAGITETHMASLAAGLASTGMKPWIYSIAPFISLKPFEQIRNDICFKELNVKIVAIGGGYAYGTMGSTHHVLEDLALMQSLPQMTSFIPAFTEDVAPIVKKMYRQQTPNYLRLGLGLSGIIDKPPAYMPVREVVQGSDIVVITLGPLVYNALQAIQKLGVEDKVSLWAISELPCSLPGTLLNKIDDAGKVFIIEEHTKFGGLAAFLYDKFVSHAVQPKTVIHHYAQGYFGTYGSQQHHWLENQLDSRGIQAKLRHLL